MSELARWRFTKPGAVGCLVILFSFFFIAVNFSYVRAEVTPEAGKELFKTYCKQCHKDAPFKDKVVGPPLFGISDVRTEDYLLKWIKDNASLRSNGDPQAIAIWEEYDKSAMPSFPNLTDDNIKSILAYVAAPPPPPPPPNGIDSNDTDGEQPSFWLYAVVGILIIIAFLLMRTNTILRRLAGEKSGIPVVEEKPFYKRFRSPRFMAFLGVLIVAVLGFTITDSSIRLGHSKNYQPKQPIAFSHALHAGINQINCLYCHGGAEKGKVAGIPPVSTCMNCHKGVMQGQTDAGTAEIRKLLTYYASDPPKPIEWTKIHNLPDHVYFNHSQHVTVAKLECQTCHGPVQEMEEVYQFSSLSMGWCINCHRSTDVKFEENGYYTQYEELHEQLKHHEIHSVTADMVGSIECQKCHY